MSTGKSRAVSARGAQEFKPHVTRGIPVTAVIACADNTGAKMLRVVQITQYKGRLRRIPSGCVGDKINVVVKKGPPDLKKQVFPAIIVRQRYPIRRVYGLRVIFDDNAAVLITPEGEVKGTEIKGPVAAEAAERWPRIASLSSIIV
jgi:large subunit ribosomal protein L14